MFDDGRGEDPDSDGAGQGLRGMAERIGLVGGSFDAGPAPTGGYRVRVRVPIPTSKEN